MTRTRTAILIIIVIGAVLRLPGIFTDFWLDEIWSYDIARGVEPAHIDNNHLLNTALIKAIGTNVREWWIYRIPPLIFGVGTIAIAAHALRRRGPAAMIIAAILLAFSFPFIFYSSEARGYSMAAFFAVLALDALLTHFENPRWTSAIAFNLTCILGFCSHLTFVHFYFAAMIWSTILAQRSKQPIVFWTRLNLPVIAFGIALYRLFVRDIAIGGAAPRDALGVLIETLSVPFGGPPVGALAVIVASSAVAILISAILLLAMKRNVMWLFYLLAIVIAPAFFLGYDLQISQRPQPLMLRYFLVALVMLLLAGAELGGAMWKHPPGRVVVIALLSAFVIASVFKTIDFHRYGRGGYSRAIAHMFDVSPDNVVTVDADNEFASGRIVDFYAPRLAPAGRSMDFRHDRAAATRAAHPAEWVIISNPARVNRKSKETTSVSNEIYRLDSEYPSESLSGISWLLYRIDIPATLRLQRAHSLNPSTQPAQQK